MANSSRSEDRPNRDGVADRRINTPLYQACLAHFSGSTLREILFAAAGMKVSRVLLSGPELAVLRRLADVHGFCLIEGRTRYMSPPDAGKGQFRNKARAASSDEPGGFQFTYVAQTAELGELAISRDEGRDPSGFGELLGIPECCRDGYKRFEPVARLKQGDLVPQVWRNTHSDKGFDPWLNVATRYFGKALISFFPCSFHCPAARSVAIETYRMMQACSPDWGRSFLDSQCTNVLYTEYHGVHAIKADLKEDTIIYKKSDVRSTDKTRVAEMIHAGNRIVVATGQKIIIYRDAAKVGIVEGGDIYACLFLHRETDAQIREA